MVHDDRARPVSGEIMSAATFHGSVTRLCEKADICDAQFETLSQSETATPAHLTRLAAADPARKTAAGMAFLTRGTMAAQKSVHPGGFLFWSAGFACAALAFWISGGHALLMNGDGQPLTGSKQALQIASVESRIEAMGGRKVLFIDGHAKNHGSLTLALPAIEIAVIGNDGDVIRYQLGDRMSRLEPGSRYEFSSRLQAPDAGVKSVSVAFAEERH